ncbi:hypothetical protein G9A89_007892 [Geosiphon pyriformis]|nr:hypothetical protein G9A89_007892 [Geosiphon pyriformis]
MSLLKLVSIRKVGFPKYVLRVLWYSQSRYIQGSVRASLHRQEPNVLTFDLSPINVIDLFEKMEGAGETCIGKRFDFSRVPQCIVSYRQTLFQPRCAS